MADLWLNQRGQGTHDYLWVAIYDLAEFVHVVFPGDLHGVIRRVGRVDWGERA